MKRFRAAVAIALVLVLASAAPASARQLDARKRPTVRGPLREVDFDGPACRAFSKRYKGRTIARGETCLRIYEVDPFNEFDVTADHGAVWLQYDIDAAPGWCVTQVSGTIEIPANNIPTFFWPHNRIATNKAKKVTARVEVHPGNDPRDISLSQPFTLYPRALTGTIHDHDDGFHVRSVWNGNTGKPLAFASGAALRWLPVLDGPGPFAYGIGYRLRNC